MTELKESIKECMYSSIVPFEKSKQYQKDVQLISNLSQELKRMLDNQGIKLLNELLDKINDSDREYAEEAYYCGVNDALNEKI